MEFERGRAPPACRGPRPALSWPADRAACGPTMARRCGDTIDAIGHMPLPPYIKRADSADDRDRYQTVYARERGSIAAPTAGLHFTPAILEALSARGVERVPVTLHVGYGTFQPIRVDRVEEHEMEAEHYEVPAETAAAISRGEARGPARRSRSAPPRRGRSSRWPSTATATCNPAAARPRSSSIRATIQARVGPDHELPPAEVVAVDAGVGLCRARARAGRVSEAVASAAIGSIVMATR